MIVQGFYPLADSSQAQGFVLRAKTLPSGVYGLPTWHSFASTMRAPGKAFYRGPVSIGAVPREAAALLTLLKQRPKGAPFFWMEPEIGVEIIPLSSPQGRKLNNYLQENREPTRYRRTLRGYVPESTTVRYYWHPTEQRVVTA